jgi:hypothetical protein
MMDHEEEDIMKNWHPCRLVDLDGIPEGYASFAAVHLNARDLRRTEQHDSLCILLRASAVNFDVVVVGETWFCDLDSNNYGIPDFNLISCCRPGGGGGGVAIYLRSALHLVSTETRCSGDGNVQVIRLHVRRPGFEGFIIGSYSRSSQDYETLLDIYDDLLPTEGDLPCLIMGDSNIDLLKPNSVSHTYCSFLSSRGLEQVVDLVTRPNLRSDAQVSGSCIDHIAIGNCDGFLQVLPFVVGTVFSDHYPVGITLTGSRTAFSQHVEGPRVTNELRRQVDSDGYLRFHQRISGADWSSVINSSDVDEAFHNFNAVLYEAYDESFPLRQRKVQQRKPYTSWFTRELRDLRRVVDRAQRRYHFKRTAEDKDVYHRWLAFYREKVAEARSNHFERLFHSLKGRPAKLWGYVNGLCGRSKKKAEVPQKLNVGDEVLVESQAVVDALNDHFATIGQKTTSMLEERGPIGDSLRSLWATGPNSFSLSTVEVHEMRVAVKGMKADLNGAQDGVPGRIILDFFENLTEPLAVVFNLSVANGRFPMGLKSTSVIPLYKGKGARDEPGNYRPISLVSFISKLFERLTKRQFEEYLDTLEFFSKNQFGFRKARSTELALAHIWAEVVSAAEDGECCLGALLDVAKAFDCIDRAHFLEMLRCLGCTDLTVSWFRSYLSQRRQTVRVGGLDSVQREVPIGTPQGSVLGPFIFIVYMNFILLGIERDVRCRPVVYADDTTLLFRVSPHSLQNDLADVVGGIETAMDHFERFGLVVNSAKTSLLLFRTSQRELNTDSIRLKIKGVDLPLTVASRCLGLTLHEHMKWEAHVTSKFGSCYSIIASLARLRRTGAHKALLLQVYRALFEPVLTYGVTLWGSTFKNVIRTAQVIQNDAIRAITGLPRRVSVSGCYPKLGVLPIDKIVFLKQASLSFRVVKGLIPSDCTFDFPSRPVASQRRAGDFRLPKCRLTLTQLSPLYQLPNAWNRLPDHIRSAPSISSFTSRLTELLLQELRTYLT